MVRAEKNHRIRHHTYKGSMTDGTLTHPVFISRHIPTRFLCEQVRWYPSIVFRTRVTITRLQYVDPNGCVASTPSGISRLPGMSLNNNGTRAEWPPTDIAAISRVGAAAVFSLLILLSPFSSSQAHLSLESRMHPVGIFFTISQIKKENGRQSPEDLPEVDKS